MSSGKVEKRSYHDDHPQPGNPKGKERMVLHTGKPPSPLQTLNHTPFSDQSPSLTHLFVKPQVNYTSGETPPQRNPTSSTPPPSLTPFHHHPHPLPRITSLSQRNRKQERQAVNNTETLPYQATTQAVSPFKATPRLSQLKAHPKVNKETPPPHLPLLQNITRHITAPPPPPPSLPALHTSSQLCTTSLNTC